MMVTTRTLSRLITAHLGLNVAAHAANLTSAGWLPDDGDTVGLDEAAMLIAAVMALDEMPIAPASTGRRSPRGAPAMRRRSPISKRS